VLEESDEQALVRAPGECAFPAGVERCAEKTAREPVEQAAGRSGVERGQLARAPEHGQVRHPPQVQDRARTGRRSEDPVVGQRRDRSALPARGDVALAEVARDRAAGLLGHEIAVAELQRRGAARFRAVVVPDRLAVARDEVEGDARARRGLPCSASEGAAEVAREQRRLAQPAAFAVERRAQARANRLGEGLDGERDRLEIRQHSGARAQAREDDVDAVGRSPRERPGDDGALLEASAQLLHGLRR
jgi:hypothetical protein